MSLVVFSGITGIILADGYIHPFMVIITVLAICLGSGAAGAINMWYDADIDSIMTRTQKRPIPQKRIHKAEALTFGIILSIVSVILLHAATNAVAAMLLASAILFYVIIYTMWLKRRTPQNIVIGGAAGAFPPMIGWAAVTGTITIESIILFTIIFLWTPPHFWALAIYRNDDYKKAKIPMLPVTHGIEATKKQILFYTILLIASTYLPYFYIKDMGLIYLVGNTILNLYFLYLALKLYLRTGPKTSIKLFVFSIFYLFLLFGLMIADKYL